MSVNKRGSSKELAVYRTFQDFYPFYLTEHSHPVNRTLHFVGTSLVLCIALYIIITSSWNKFLYLPLCGYGFAWVGHFFFEKNKPATFKYPFYSFAGDWNMWYDIITGKEPLLSKYNIWKLDCLD